MFKIQWRLSGGSRTDFHMVVKADLILAFNYGSNTISHLQHRNTCLNSQISPKQALRVREQ